jgi:hypothetical protein
MTALPLVNERELRISPDNWETDADVKHQGDNEPSARPRDAQGRSMTGAVR